MHRQISHTDEAFQRERNTPLYLFTALLGAIIAADWWPVIAEFVLGATDISLPTWPREIFGYRIVLFAAILGGMRVAHTSLESLLEGKLGADLAIAIACIAAILIGEPMVAAEIVFIGMLGECLESYTFDRTRRAIRKVVEIFPHHCWVLRDGREVRSHSVDLNVGDQVVIKPGGRVPVDGIILSGRSTLDQSALSGESYPVDRGPGDEVLAGSLNQLGSIVVEARRVAAHTVAGQVIELTSKALKDKAGLERTADRLARLFLPAVLGLAGLTFLGTLLIRSISNIGGPGSSGMVTISQSVYPALSVLVVACPCPLILATPAAIIAALGRLAGTGVLVKGGSALERLAAVDAFAFDKTGTLTEGQLEIGDVLTFSELAADEILGIAATAEQKSEHVIGRALTEAATRRGLDLSVVDQFLAQPGAGVETIVGGAKIVVGNRRILEERGIPLTQEVVSCIDQLDRTGQTALWVARNQVVLGAIGVRDRVRPEAAGVIEDLRALGIHDIWMLTGDRSAVAKSVSGQVGIDEVHAELLPAQKAEFIQSQQSQTVAMVGDGINDAPALARARVGLAVGGATDLAAEAGDFVLMGDPLRPLPLLVKLSRETVRIIRQNIVVFAFGVNAVGIIVTAWLWPLLATAPGWYEQGPLAAVIYHQLGSFAVLLNAMRLLWFERAPTAGATRRMSRKLYEIDHWLAHRFDAHEFRHWLHHHKRGAIAALAIAVIVLYGLSGFAQIGPDEVAIVTRFGKPVADLDPGLYWRWPWPIEQVLRAQPARIQIVEIGFRSPISQVSSSSLAWATSHGIDGSQASGDEGMLITGDGNLVEMQATVRFYIDDVHAYLSQTLDHRGILHALAESALRETIANQSFAELLTANRDRFQRQVRNRIEELQGRYPSLGMKLDGLSVHDLHPPQDVVPAYHDVAKAMETRDHRINAAQAEAIMKTSTAHAEARQLIRRAEAEANQTVRLAAAARDSFLARWQARTQLGSMDEKDYFGSAMSQLQRKNPPAAVYEQYEKQRALRLKLNAMLIDFRLFWDALSRGLANRDKIVIDADNVSGHRNLFLIDPEKFRPPAIPLNPSGNSPSTRSSSRFTDHTDIP
jgi:Cu+-exporting ATPase